jgi:hypothetical protein
MFGSSGRGAGKGQSLGQAVSTLADGTVKGFGGKGFGASGICRPGAATPQERSR